MCADSMTPQPPRRPNPSGIVLGSAVLLLGVVFLLNELNLLDWDVWRFWPRYWPVILIALGAVKLMQPRKDGAREGGFLVFIGVWLLLNQTGVLWWGESWPLILIAVGVSIVWKAVVRRGTIPAQPASGVPAEPPDARGGGFAS